MKIYIQSQIDLITNSSTEVFQIADSGLIKDLKEIIDAILEIGGSNYKCDDLFEVKIEYDEEYYLSEFIEETPLISDSEKEYYWKANWGDELCKQLEERVKTQYSKDLKKFTENKIQYNLDNGDGSIPSMCLEIIPKDTTKNYSRLFSRINNLLESHAMYC